VITILQQGFDMPDEGGELRVSGFAGKALGFLDQALQAVGLDQLTRWL